MGCGVRGRGVKESYLGRGAAGHHENSAIALQALIQQLGQRAVSVRNHWRDRAAASTYCSSASSRCQPLVSRDPNRAGKEPTPQLRRNSVVKFGATMIIMIQTGSQDLICPMQHELEWAFLTDLVYLSVLCKKGQHADTSCCSWVV